MSPALVVAARSCQRNVGFVEIRPGDTGEGAGRTPRSPRYARSLAVAALLGLGSITACERASSDPASARQNAAEATRSPTIQLHGEGRAPFGSIVYEGDNIGNTSDATDTATHLYLVEGAVTLANGDVVIANRGTNQLVVHDRSGRRSRTIGGPGNGPGEFAQLKGVVKGRGDTLLTFDAQQDRVTALTHAGTYVRDFRIALPERAAPSALAGVMGLVDDHLVLWNKATLDTDHLANLNRPDVAGDVPILLFSIDAAGGVDIEFGTFPGTDMYLGSTTSPAGESVLANWGPAPFGDVTTFGVAGDRVYAFSSADEGFTVYDARGTVVATYRGTWPKRRVSPEARRSWIDEWVDRFPAWLSEVERRALFNRATFPEHMPAFRDATVGTDGVVWLEPYAMWNGISKNFVLFDSSGLAVERLTLPYDSRILEIGNGRGLLLIRDEDGVERVHSFRYFF